MKTISLPLSAAVCVIGLLLCVSPGSPAQTFTATGSLNTARDNHTETLLNNGMILVVGGTDTNGHALASAELYNPATGLFTYTGSLHTARWDHTATLLPNGMVLIAGGSASSSSAFTSAELYNPATGTFTVTGSMHYAREQHTATLLGNGLVLVAGGLFTYDTAELYNPATGTFAVTGNLITGRWLHTATLLGNGSVLITGGYAESAPSPTATAELYNPSLGAFFPTGNMNSARVYHTATLLNTEMVLVAAGSAGSSAELYNPGSGTFTLTGSLNVAREVQTAALLNLGDVLIAGGTVNNTGVLASAELYDPATGTFTLTGSMTEALDMAGGWQRGEQTILLGASGQVLLAGGWNGSTAVSTAQIYNGPAAVTGLLYPAYKIQSIIYAAPGNRSSNGFTNTTTDGTSTAITDSFSMGTSTTFSESLGFLGVGTTLGWTFGSSTTQGNSSAFTDTISQATGVANASNSSSPDAINHQQDLFVLWLNPAVSLTQTGSNSLSYSIGTQSQTAGDPDPGQPEVVDSVEVFAQAMLPNALGATTVPVAILEPQVVDGQTLPGLAAMCASHPYYPNSCTLGNQCGCVPSDFAAILANDPLLNYSSTESPLNADTSGATACTNPSSSDSCRYVPMLSNAQQITEQLMGPEDPGGNIPVNTFLQSDATQTTNTLSETTSYTSGSSEAVMWTPLGTGPRLMSMSMFTWGNTESVGESNGSAHTMTVTLSSSTVGCSQDIPIFEDTVYHTFVFQQPSGDNSCSAAPSITELSPASGVVGTAVSIAGSNFGATQGTSTVKFNGTSATVTSWSATSIAVTVPGGASTGSVVVTVEGFASSGFAFTVLPTPNIASLSVTSGAVGTPVTITGTNFGATQGTSTVKFSGTAGVPTSWSATSIVVPVPSGTATGSVVVTVGGQASNGITFTVTVPAPSITSLSVTSGPVGTPVTITGTNFGATQGTSTVKFSGTAGVPTSWSATSIVVPVPSGSATGSVVVTVGGQASNGIAFSVTTIGDISVTVTPSLGGATITQQIQLAATVTNDIGSAGVIWSVSSGGTLTNQTTTSASFSAATAGVYTITATSLVDITESATATIGVTDLSGVYSYHNDSARDGVNAQEYALTTSNVNTSSFGKLFSCAVDGAVYAQPLWVANVNIGGIKHNVVFVATEHDSLFAFDADASPCVQLWKVNLIDTNHGATSGEVTVPSGPTGYLVGGGSGDITPEVGVSGTPAIDPSTGTLYVVSKSVNSGGTAFYQRLHAIDITTGNEKFSGPANITSSITFPGTGDGGSTDSFNTQQENQRSGLALVNGVVYVVWASHEDHWPYYGWVVGFNASNLAVTSVLNVTPNVDYGGIWMAGGAPASDANNNLYLITGNAQFDVTSNGDDYGDSFLQLSSDLTVSSFFTPSDQQNDYDNDRDFGSGGAAVVLNLNSGTLKHLVIGGGKDGTLYLLNGDNMGGLGDSNARQNFALGHGIFATGAFWNNNYYVAGISGPLVSFSFNTSTNMFNPSIAFQSATNYGFPGSTPSVSATGTTNGIVWALDSSAYCTYPYKSCGPAILHAYDATTLGSDLWNSSIVSADAAGNAVKFTVPTVANGKVYVGTRGNNTGGVFGSTSISGELDVYGLKSN